MIKDQTVRVQTGGNTWEDVSLPSGAYYDNNTKRVYNQQGKEMKWDLALQKWEPAYRIGGRLLPKQYKNGGFIEKY
jgi:hypothetical protein